MNVSKFEFEEKHHFLEVDGTQYEIPQRTEKLQKKIREHDEKVQEMTEYEANYSALEILFGKVNAKKMFPDGQDTNLDKLAKCAKYALALYMAEYNAIRDEDITNRMKRLEPFLQQLSNGGELLKQAQTQAKPTKVTRKK